MKFTVFYEVPDANKISNCITTQQCESKDEENDELKFQNLTICC